MLLVNVYVVKKEEIKALRLINGSRNFWGEGANRLILTPPSSNGAENDWEILQLDRLWVGIVWQLY